jgi:transposase InsO family protein
LAVPSTHLLIAVLRRPVEFTQYTSIRFIERLAEAGIQPSVGAVGSSYDNALTETINGLYKTELIKPRKPRRTIETSRTGHRRMDQLVQPRPPLRILR